MKKINEMSIKELREVAKELNIAGRWDMTKARLVEAIEKIENEKKRLQSKLRRNPTKKKQCVYREHSLRLVILVRKFTDTISFTKAAGKIAVQRQYVGKLMTKAMAALK